MMEDHQHAWDSTGHSGAVTLCFFLLCMTWMYAGAFLWLGQQIVPQVPAIFQTIAFVLLAGIMVSRRTGWLRSIGCVLEKHSLAWISFVIVVYLVFFRFGSIHLLDTPYSFALVLGLLVIAIIAWDSGRNRLALFAFMLVVTILAILDLQAVPLGARGNQLYLVSLANQTLLGGDDPYRYYFSVIGKNEGTLNYFPALWLPYISVVLFGIDVRWLNVLLIAAFPLLTFTQIRITSTLSRSAKLLPNACCFALFLNPGFIDYLVNAQIAPDCIYLFLLVQGIARGQKSLIVFGLGLSLAARQTTLAILPIALVVFPKLYANVARIFLGAALVAAVLLAGFIYLDPIALYTSTIQFNQNWYAERASSQGQILGSWISLAGPFFSSGLSWLLQPLQGVLVLGLTLWWSLRRTFSPSMCIAAIASVYGVFLLFNPILWTYYWIPFLLVMLALAVAEIKALSLLRSKQLETVGCPPP